ncbi:MAG: hypothetical protein Q4G67_15610 [Actinomycetia bacterium]|nr:hypothetical protein [Actinomycetes bacterium]
MTDQHTPAEEHTHRHGPECGHEARTHGDHVDYLHDGHAHREHDDHYDECTCSCSSCGDNCTCVTCECENCTCENCEHAA